MRKILLPVVLILLLAAVSCTPAHQAVVNMIAGDGQPSSAPLGGQVAALPTPVPKLDPTGTPAPSRISLPTEAPPAVGPLATLTAVAALIATPVLDAEPYEIELQGRPHFIEFHAWW